MSFLFGKKQAVQAMAELIEDGRAQMNKELSKAKYNEYRGAEPMIKMRVRVLPENETPFEAVMKSGVSQAFLLKMGVRVRVKYDPAKKEQVTLDDDNQAILARNPQLTPKQ